MKKQRLAILILIVALFCFGKPERAAAQNETFFRLIDDYSAALDKLEKQNGKQSIEPVVRKGQAVAEKLDVLESLSETDYAAAEKRLRGFLVNRTESVFIEPDNEFFLNLAKRRGTASDVAFFTLMGEVKPDNVWWAFIEQQTDVTGCTIYGSGSLTRLYGKIKAFKKQHPTAYADNIKEATDAIKNEFVEGTCACGNRGSVTREFQLFVKTYPKDELTPAIKKRLAEIVRKRTTMRFACQSG